MFEMRDDTGRRGTAPLIGIILLVGVAVVIGSVLAVVTLGIGEDTTETAPVATIEVESRYFGDGVPKNDSLVFTHVGGDSLDRSNIEIVVGGDVIFNETANSESNSNTNTVPGLVVEVDDDEFNDLNKPCRASPPSTCGGPPGDGDGSDPGVVHQWEEDVEVGQRLVIQERNAPKAYDVLQPGEEILVRYQGEETTAVITRATVAPEVDDD